MASSPALPTQGATEEVTRKREVRLMKNRYGGGFLLMHEKFPSVPSGVFVMLQKQEKSLQARLNLPSE